MPHVPNGRLREQRDLEARQRKAAAVERTLRRRAARRRRRGTDEVSPSPRDRYVERSASRG